MFLLLYVNVSQSGFILRSRCITILGSFGCEQDGDRIIKAVNGVVITSSPSLLSGSDLGFPYLPESLLPVRDSPAGRVLALYSLLLSLKPRLIRAFPGFPPDYWGAVEWLFESSFSFTPTEHRPREPWERILSL